MSFNAPSMAPGKLGARYLLSDSAKQFSREITNRAKLLWLSYPFRYSYENNTGVRNYITKDIDEFSERNPIMIDWLFTNTPEFRIEAKEQWIDGDCGLNHKLEYQVWLCFIQKTDYLRWKLRWEGNINP